ncbi:MAG: ABC transporter permease [Chloroflexi bacterium]|nr:ABC transporter permease [Chloroflexota bacterium]
MMMLPTLRAARVWQRNRDVFLRLWKTEVGGMIAEPVVMLTALGFGLGAYVESIEGKSYAQFVAPGIIASYAMFHAVFECTFSTYLRMETHKIFDGIIVTPVNVEDLVMGEAAWGATRSVLTASAILAFSYVLGLVSSPWALLVVPLSFVVGLAFASIALTVTAIVPYINSLNNFFTLFITPMWFFSGVFFPLAELPPSVATVAWFLPLTAAVRLMRGLAFGELDWAVLGSFLILCGFSILFLFLALYTMRRRLIK